MVSKNNNYGSKVRSPYSEDYRIPTFKLLVRAYDLGIPQKSNAVPVTVYGPETNARNMTFILNGFPIEQKEAEAMLSKVTGGRVKIQEVRPYQTRQIRSSDDSEKTSSEKSIVEARVLYDDNPTVDLTQFQNALKNQSTVVVYKKEKVEEYHRAESALFWILMVLAILIVIIVILLLLCCICPGCPLYVNPKKGKQVDPHAEESVHLVVKEEGPGMETKAVQAEWMGHRREAWSADQRQQRYHSWRFNRRNIPTKEHDELYSTGLDDRRYGYDIQGPAAASLGARGHEDRHSLHSLPAQHVRVRDGPTVIYTRELQDLQRHADNRHRDTIYVEDIEGADYPPPGQIVDHRQARGHPHREVRINAEEDHDTDSIRRHEAERGSDLGRGGEYRRGEGHRDVDNEDREYRFVLRRGQRVKHSDGDEDDPQELSTAAPSRREQFYIRDGNAEILRLVTRGRSGDEQEFAQVGPQPEQRPMTLVPPRQQHHNGKEIIMQRFMEDQRNNSSQQGDAARAEETAPDTALLTSLQQQDLLVRRLLEEEARLNNTLLLTEALVAQRQHEQYLATAGENMETQSLPGQALMATMATQTDVDSSTQTEPMHLMRPPRRRARSDNDDSYTEEEDKEGTTAEENASRLSLSGSAVHGLWIKKHRSKRKRSSLNRDLRMKRAGGKSLPVPGRRHKIKTPIMEETESALEAAERQSSAIPDHIPGGNYTENKTSLLRRRNNKAKVATSSGEMEVTSVPNPRQNGLEDVEEETPTDSLEERSPKKRKKYASDDNRGSGYRSHSPLRVSASTGDVRNVNFDDNRWPPPKRHHVEFQESDSSDKREMSDERRGSLSDKGRARASSYAASSDSTSGRPSELESSIEVKDNESQNLPGEGEVRCVVPDLKLV
ncbi:hypothetical protein ANN_11805 [Periplaneta americana]|uniref:Uncharacterized protein n=1 Tax=Periplaneta americana TaxID=6978 RepID=A0ABQ8T629_PERAM|nr:hypothetical protein ANN_11805 [Periplaneta americana]